MSDLTQAMNEYAQAIRGDWSDFDGRSEQGVIEAWISEIEKPTGKTIDEWRQSLGICLDGNGHWSGVRWGHCSEDCPKEWAHELEWRAEDEARKAAKEVSDK